MALEQIESRKNETWKILEANMFNLSELPSEYFKNKISAVFEVKQGST